MHWTNFQLSLPDALLAGKYSGTGPHVLLCLHGYGNDRHLFDPVFQGTEAASLTSGGNQPAPHKGYPDGWWLISFDLPGFGASQWHDPAKRLGPEFLKALLARLQEQFPWKSLHIMGYSLGARVAIGMLLAGAPLLRSLHLLAPDGLKIHPLYKFCVYNPLGKQLFRLVLRFPGLFLLVIRSLYNLRLVDAFNYRFVSKQFQDREALDRIKLVWEVYAGIRPRTPALVRQTELQAIRWHLLWGKKDTVLPPAIGVKFQKKVPEVRLHLFDAGHLLIYKNEAAIRTLLWNNLQTYTA